LLVVGACPLVADDTWSQFRGNATNGVAEAACPLEWDTTTNVLWKVAIDGEGWSCPVVWGDRLFLTTAVPGSDGSYRWDVVCLDATSGETRWRQTARTGRPSIPRHNTNTYATETATTDGERVYAYFGMHGLYCYDIEGQPLWSKDLGVFEMRGDWGTSSSPVLFDGKLFVQVDNEQQSFVVALDAQTGNELWRVDRNEKSQYSSPMIWQNSERNELIVGGMVYRSHDPDTGKLLWQLDMAKGRSSATPLALGDRLYVGTEYRSRGGADDGGGFLFAIKPGGSGDIADSDFVEWKTAKSGIQMASPVESGGYIYLLERNGGIINCVETATGKLMYTKRIAGARPFWASPWTSGGRVYCLDDGGTTHVIEPGPTLNIVAANRLDEQTWSTPAIVDGNIYLRTVGHLYCIGNLAQ
jgi:outer membrane protein assembly factor BamB